MTDHNRLRPSSFHYWGGPRVGQWVAIYKPSRHCLKMDYYNIEDTTHPYKVDGITYTSVEQYIQCKQAIDTYNVQEFILLRSNKCRPSWGPSCKISKEKIIHYVTEAALAKYSL